VKRPWFKLAPGDESFLSSAPEREDYVVEEISPSRCRFTWTVAFEAPAAARPGNPINRLITRSLFRDTRRNFEVR
jgi:hypothetical protein